MAHIDLLSRDIEQGEPAALSTLEIDRFRPALVCIKAPQRSVTGSQTTSNARAMSASKKIWSTTQSTGTTGGAKSPLQCSFTRRRGERVQISARYAPTS